MLKMWNFKKLFPAGVQKSQFVMIWLFLFINLIPRLVVEILSSQKFPIRLCR